MRFALLLAVLAACQAGPPQRVEWEPVAAFQNPALGPDPVVDQAYADLDRAHIEQVSVGSLGYTLSVPTTRAAEARRILSRYRPHVNLL